VTVPAGATLTIDPGVRVEMAPGRSIFVEGELVARGTEAEPIVFTGRDRGSGPEYWGSLVFQGSSRDAVFASLHGYLSGSIVEHCVLEYGRRAIQVKGSSPFITQSTFRHNQTEASVDIAGGAAMSVEAGGRPRIQGCTFEGNRAELFTYGGAIYVKEAEPIIQDNVFRSNWATYGGAIATDLMASPIVGNVFLDNSTVSEGGALSLVSTVSLVANNEVRGNHAPRDGGGIHVCTTCFPHANPFVVDNTIVGNSSDAASPSEGAAGVGAAYLRALSHNNLHGNLRRDQPSDFGWFHPLSAHYPSWVANPELGANWWGTDNLATISATVFDGSDDPTYGTVSLAPVLGGPVTAPRTRVTATTREICIAPTSTNASVFLTVYHPGAARQWALELALILDGGQAIPWQGNLDFPGATRQGSLHLIQMPENGVYFTALEMPLGEVARTGTGGTWTARLTQVGSDTPVDVSSARIAFAEGC
jgi:predicted outer membrane repeat protein